MKRWLLLLLVLLFAALDTPRDATACGGPDYGDFGALAPLNATLSELVMPEAEWASWGNARMPELRFLYPFEKAEPKKAELAWKLAHEDLTKAAPPAMAPLDDAMTRDDLPAIDREARRRRGAHPTGEGHRLSGGCGLIEHRRVRQRQTGRRRGSHLRGADVHPGSAPPA